MTEEETTEKDSIDTKAQSWGDRWRKPAFGYSTYFWFNGVFNLLFSVALAYVCELKFENKIVENTNALGSKIASKIGLSAKKVSGALYFAVKGTLLSGGFLLLPILKVLEDGRQRFEFIIGNKLDRLQVFFGQGNSASKRNIADYSKLTHAMGDHGTVELTSEEQERFKKKYRLEVIDDNMLVFKEHQIPWIKLLAARASAMLFTDWGVSGALGYVGLSEKLEKSGPTVTRGINAVFPWYSKLLKQPDVFSKNLAADVILTASIAGVHKVTQDLLHNEDHDANQEQADLKHLIRIKKKTKIAQQPTNFRARQEAQTSDAAAMVMS